MIHAGTAEHLSGGCWDALAMAGGPATVHPA